MTDKGLNITVAGETETTEPLESTNLSDSREPAHIPEDVETPGAQIDIRTVRIRHFFEFESLLTLKRIEEHTIYNSIETLNQITYLSGEFKPHLEIFDSDGKKLIFHSKLENYDNFQDETIEETEDSDQDDFFPIVIEFPEDKPLFTRQFRTLLFSYLEDLDFEKEVPVVKVPLGAIPHVYLHVKKLTQFKTDIGYLIESSNKQTFSVYNLDEYESEHVILESTESYSRFSTSKEISNCNLLIGFKYGLHNWDKYWFNSGIVIGILALTINCFLIIIGLKANLTGIIAIAGIANTYLILTKGWLFMKDMDRFTSYTNIYLTLIFLIFFEIVIAIILSMFDFSFIQNTYFIVDQHMQMNITL